VSCCKSYITRGRCQFTNAAQFSKLLGRNFSGQATWVFGSGYAFQHPSISRRAGLHFVADGFAFFAVGGHEFVIELEIHP
jgi:hypothetical protein